MLSKGLPSLSPHSEYWIVNSVTGSRWGVWGGWIGRSLGELLGALKEHIQTTSQMPSRSPPLTTGNTSLAHRYPQGSVSPTHILPTLWPSPCVHFWQREQASYWTSAEVSQTCGLERDHNLSLSANYRKTEEKLLALGLRCWGSRKRMLASEPCQRGSQNHEQVHMDKVWASPSISSRADGKYFYPEGS